jgi:DNA-binding CsgD family transcriptional regulator
MPKKIVADSGKKQNYATAKQIAVVLNISELEVKKFVRLGMPKFEKDKFNLVEAVHWYLDYQNHWRDKRTLEEIADMLGITRRWLLQIVTEKGVKREGRGVYQLSSTVLAYVNQLKDNLKKSEEGSTSLNEEKTRLLSMQASLREMELMEKRKLLVPKQLVEHFALNLTVLFGKKLDSIPGTILNKLFASKTKEEMLHILNDIIYKIKNDIATERN